MSRLASMGYDINECLLSPIQFGIPNHRLRYYLTARRQKDQAPAVIDVDDRTIHTTWPFDKAQSFTVPELALFLEQPTDDSFTVPSRYILRLHNFRLGKCIKK